MRLGRKEGEVMIMIGECSRQPRIPAIAPSGLQRERRGAGLPLTGRPAGGGGGECC